ncbi:MAG: photosystem II S4 domain protein [Synechococcus lacustris]
MLPRKQLLAGAAHPEALSQLLALAETALRTHQPCWSGFLAAPVREEAEARFAPLGELQLAAEGGYGQAERRRLRLERQGSPPPPAAPPIAPLALLEISGNFLFDPAEAADFRLALEQGGVAAAALGDLLVRGDRGALLICSPEAAQQLQGQPLLVRSVACQLQPADWARLGAQEPRQKSLSTVEASLRLDAVASAGFGISRSRMAELIRLGKVRINWNPVDSPSRELKPGDRIQLLGRGELVLETVLLTKRDRWRLTLTRVL